MKTVAIDGGNFQDWEEFHDYFKETFGFPEFYGKNMDAWIDCMTYLDDPESGMSKVTVGKGELIVLQIINAEHLKQTAPDIYLALLECSSFVNHRRIEVGDEPLIILSF